MVSFQVAAILAVVSGACQASLGQTETITTPHNSRRLSYELIAGYEPRSLVTDYVRYFALLCYMYR
jgi:hypothetical protein